MTCMYMYDMHVTNMCLGDHAFVELDESVNGALSYLQRGEVGEEVVPHKETHEDPVVQCPL